MNKQAKFYDLPTEPAPFNRRVYAAATAPFAWMWDLLARLVEWVIRLALNIVWAGVQCILFFGACFAVLALLLYICM